MILRRKYNIELTECLSSVLSRNNEKRNMTLCTVKVNHETFITIGPLRATITLM